MKKKIYLLSVSFSLLLFACSKENDNLVNKDLTSESNTQLEGDYNLNAAIDEKYDGSIFKFEDEDDFIKFYSALTNLEDEEFNEFLFFKGENNSSFYRDLSIEEEALGEDITLATVQSDNDSVLFVSEYLSTIFNYDNHIMIGENLINLSRKGVFSIVSSKNKSVLNDKIGEVIGYVNSNSNKSTSQNNKTNKINSWTKTQNGKRATYSIFDESIYLSNNSLASSKVFYRVSRQYESCSFWRCKWKNDSSTAYLYNVSVSTYGGCRWTGSLAFPGSSASIITTNSSTYTVQLAYYNLTGVGPCSTSDFSFEGTFRCSFSGGGFDQTFSDLSYYVKP